MGACAAARHPLLDQQKHIGNEGVRSEERARTAVVVRGAAALVVMAQAVAAAAVTGGGSSQNSGENDLIVLLLTAATGVLGAALLVNSTTLLRAVVAAWEALILVAVLIAGRVYGSDGPVYFNRAGSFALIGDAHNPPDLAPLVLWAISVIAVLAFVTLWPTATVSAPTLVNILRVGVVGLCASMSFAWYEQARMFLDRLGGWNGIEGHAELGYGVDAPIESITIVDEQDGSMETVSRDAHGWLRIALPPGTYRLTLCPRTTQKPTVEVVVPQRGYASISDDLLAPLRGQRTC